MVALRAELDPVVNLRQRQFDFDFFEEDDRVQAGVDLSDAALFGPGKDDCGRRFLFDNEVGGERRDRRVGIVLFTFASLVVEVAGIKNSPRSPESLRRCKPVMRRLPWNHVVRSVARPWGHLAKPSAPALIWSSWNAQA